MVFVVGSLPVIWLGAWLKCAFVRNQERVDELLGKLMDAAKGTENLMPLFIECVENDITLGEICNTLRSVWGEYVAEGF